MFYDYTEILESDYFQNNTAMAEELVMQILVSILKGIKIITMKILRLSAMRMTRSASAPMIDPRVFYVFHVPGQHAAADVLVRTACAVHSGG